MYRFFLRITGLLAAAIAVWQPTAPATTVCVSDSTSLVVALTNWPLQADGSNLTIKLVRGTYALGNALGNRFYGTYPRSIGLSLLGGYGAGCGSRQLNPANTVLDGLDQDNGGLALGALGDADVRIEGLTFTRFRGSGPYNTILKIGLEVDTSDVAGFSVRYNRFVRNAATHVLDVRGARLAVVNNLLADNVLSGQAAAALFARYVYNADSALAATNNTIASNTGGAGILMDNGDQASGRISELADNILWGNGIDLDLGRFDAASNIVQVSYNVVGTVAGHVLSADNTRGDPRFINAAAGNYRLATNSPAINSGAPLQWSGYPAQDLGGGSRIVGSRIDRGAWESALDDTTTAVVTTAADNGNNAAPLAGSLRAAIKAGNAASGPFRITFNIAGGCPSLLPLVAAMPDISGDVTIDGTTQPGWAPNDGYGRFDATLCLYLNGAGNSNTPWAFHVPASAPGSARLVVRGIGFAGFNDAAIKLEGGRNHRIAGNLFGPIAFTPPSYSAIRVSGAAGGAFIGGYDDPAAVNLIAVASGPGIELDNAAGGSVIANNVIGIGADGTSNGGNQSGIFVYDSPANTIQYNYIGNNSGGGVVLSGALTTGNVLQYNTIGEDVNGGDAGNGIATVLVSFAAGGNTIGAPVGAEWGGNHIANADDPGVWLSPSAGTGNSVLDNEFLDDAGLDIDLAAQGATANQPANPASGPNGLQNYPSIASASFDAQAGELRVTGELVSAANRSYRIDLYWTSYGRPDNRGQGERPLPRFMVTTNAQGRAAFTHVQPVAWLQSAFGSISGTATDMNGNTSELGNSVAITIADRIFRDGFD